MKTRRTHAWPIAVVALLWILGVAAVARAQRWSIPPAGFPGWLAAWYVSVALTILWPLLAVAALVQRVREPAPVEREIVVDAALVVAGTLAAAALLSEPSMANWYVDFLPATGNFAGNAARFGSAALALELPVRAIVPWTDRSLYGFTLIASALGSAAAYAALRALALPRATCLLATAILAVHPLAVRVAWSGSPHALVFALFCLLLLAWVRAQEPGRPAELALALVLVPTLAFTRVDAILFAAAPLAFGLARENWRRRLALAAVYVAVLAASAWLVWHLVALPAGVPTPTWAERARAARAVLRGWAVQQFFHVPSSANWFPWPVAALLLPGAAVLAVRRPALLAAVAATVIAPQIALARLANDAGLIGCRYFFPAFPLLALLAAAPLGPLAWPERLARATRARAVRVVLATAAVVATVVAGWPMYHYRYAYQAEYIFLREHLAAASGRRARVFHVSVHGSSRLKQDPDCCLNPGASPLTLVVRGVSFEPLEIDPANARIPDADGGEAYYYESSICSLGATEQNAWRNPGLPVAVRATCARLAADPRLELVASARVPGVAAWDLFQDPEIEVRLFRLAPVR